MFTDIKIVEKRSFKPYIIKNEIYSGEHTMNTEEIENKEEIIEIIDERPQKNPQKYWAFAAVCIVAILVAGFLLYKFNLGVYNTVNKMFRSNVYNTEIVLNTIGELQQESKIVVMTAELTVEMQKSSSKVLWDWYHLGTTVVEMKVPGNKVQYYIPADSLNTNNIYWDHRRQEIVIDLPDVVLDEDIVEVQSDPSKIMIRKDIGWARFESQSGMALENQIRSELRNKVIEAGKHELLLEKAKANAEKVIKELFERLKKEKDAGIFV
ncbi:MAG: DUF4230 domain-containing protein [Candidatus Delongbacteria bacterium]|nr:DUF4230 domain-containing protein [Candidatus Delongbacteria bacterium]